MDRVCTTERNRAQECVVRDTGIGAAAEEVGPGYRSNPGNAHAEFEMDARRCDLEELDTGDGDSRTRCLTTQLGSDRCPHLGPSHTSMRTQQAYPVYDIGDARARYG